MQKLYTEKEAFFNCAFLAALANGNSIIHGVNATPEITVFADYLRDLGATVSINGEQWEITGVNFKCKKDLNLDWVGGDFPHQKRNKKIIECLLSGDPFSCEEKISVRNSLIRELCSFGVELEFKQDGPEETDEFAKRMAKMQGIKTEKKWICNIPPVPSILARDRFIAGDATQAACLALAASLIPNSDVTIKAVNLDSSRAGIFGTFRRLGADIEIVSRHERGNDVWGDLRVKTAMSFNGTRLGPDVLATCLDEIPLLAVLACFAEGETILRLPPWATAFYKPVLSILYENLECGLYEDGLILRGKSKMKVKNFDCKNYPIVGFALHILNLKIRGKDSVAGIECVENMFPGGLNFENWHSVS